MSRRRVKLGERGEKTALSYFEKLGYRQVKSNHRSRTGEIDLILQDGDTLVFCEVKTKDDLQSGHAAESYGRAQQKRMRRLILGYLSKTGWDGPIRVDLLALQKENEGDVYKLHHFKDALALDDNW